MRLTKLRSGSYETPDGSHFTYRYRPEDGTAPYWLVYRQDDTQLDIAPTLRHARHLIALDLQ